jgi:V8-like Glu-specific endopeptidase
MTYASIEGRKSMRAWILAPLAGLLFAPVGLGQELAVNPLSHEETLNQWTPEMFRDARPLELRANLPLVGGAQEKASPPEVLMKAHPPIAQVEPMQDNFLFEAAGESQEESAKKPAAAPLFSSSRVIPLSADQFYPYSAVGKLFFKKKDGSSWLCSASVVSQRLVLTAGHCVHDGSGQASGYYSDFVFIPAYRDRNAPFGSWTWASVLTTSPWYSGRQNVPNASDFAILEMNDLSTGRIGIVVGWFGTLTNRLASNHVLSLGYPLNIDGGEKLHQCASQSIGSTGLGTVSYGTDMEGGSSGGPWVQSFGAPGQGEGGLYNYVVGVTSFGTPGSKRASSSTLDAQVTSALGVMCNHRAGNCS